MKAAKVRITRKVRVADDIGLRYRWSMLD